MAVAISAPSLHQKCKREALKWLSEEEILILSWFKSSFGQKIVEPVALNYIGGFQNQIYDAKA